MDITECVGWLRINLSWCVGNKAIKLVNLETCLPCSFKRNKYNLGIVLILIAYFARSIGFVDLLPLSVAQQTISICLEWTSLDI